MRLSQLCKRERGMFCANVPTVNSGKVIECLEDNRRQPNMSSKCRAAIKVNMEIKSRHVLLNRPLLNACFANFHKICRAPTLSKLSDEGSAKLITCMLEKREMVLRHYGLYCYILMIL